MTNQVSFKLIAAFAALFAVIVLSSTFITGARIDLSENGLYTLSDGTESILGKLERPVSIEYYFSDKATSQLPALRTYAKRVEELLNEYQATSSRAMVSEVGATIPIRAWLPLTRVRVRRIGPSSNKADTGVSAGNSSAGKIITDSPTRRVNTNMITS